ncbi:DUF3006 domain-containing protein [Acetanaerobacterium elongatum]|uniref:DUF3006 domain-containing protein n=1 Tax=Acetanaerobacterium elongatum TaxID=258515 RepID=A0A1H0B0C2_9FIRM|nr:DUF3006 domain-containing protein [Acetanaerobacterium elongatum]SDN39078.1 Protein of unknown function [Acetanaerobacterium elongatum]
MTDKLLRIDRLEGTVAVCEDEQGGRVQLPVCSLPAGVKEGDCLKLDDTGRAVVDTEETRHRRELIKKLQQQVFSEE